VYSINSPDHLLTHELPDCYQPLLHLALFIASHQQKLSSEPYTSAEHVFIHLMLVKKYQKSEAKNFPFNLKIIQLIQT
jgi:hypothetical protein